MKPLVSIIMPSFNAEEYIKEALEALFAQTVTDYEIIVVDDGSSDRTLEIIQSFGDKIRLIKQKNSGPGTARNRAMFKANGEYFAFCDADDVWEKDKLEKQMIVVGTNPSCGLVATNGMFIDEKGQPHGKYLVGPEIPKEKITKICVVDILQWVRINPTATLVSRDAVLKSDLLFDRKNFTYEDNFL